MLSRPGQGPSKILLVDDHPIVRLGFMSLLRQVDPSIEFHEAANRNEAMEVALSVSPCIALVDLSLAGTLALDLIKQFRERLPAMSILVVSMHDEKVYAERALRAGAQGYVMKQIAAKSIILAVRTVCEGRVWLSEDFRRELDGRMVSGGNPAALTGLSALSDRELGVFQLIGRGLKKSGIASLLSLSPHTVETHRTNIKQKMGVASGAELYRIAFLHSQGTEN